MRAGCATQVPSCPSSTSRSLSPRTLSITACRPADREGVWLCGCGRSSTARSGSGIACPHPAQRAQQQQPHTSTHRSLRTPLPSPTHLVSGLVSLDWNHGAHAAHGKAAAVVARLHNQLHTGRAGREAREARLQTQECLALCRRPLPAPSCAPPRAPPFMNWADTAPGPTHPPLCRRA